MLERPQPARAPAPAPREQSERVVRTTVVLPVERPIAPARSLAGVWVLLSVLIVGFIGLMAAMGIFADSLGGALSGTVVGTPDRVVANWTPILVPTTYTQSPDILLIAYNSDTEVYSLTLVDGVTRSVRWRKPLSKEGYYQSAAVPDQGRVYVADGSRLVALDQAKGQSVWEAALADVLPEKDCLRIFGERVVALTKDGQVQAFDKQTGRPAWNVRLTETPRRLWDVAGQPAVLDQKESGKGAYLAIFNPADGKVVQQITPKCRVKDHPWDETLYTYNPVLVDNERQRLYFLFGSQPMCVQCADSATGKALWATSVADVHLSWVKTYVLAGDALYVTTGTGGGILAVVDTNKGTARQLVSDKDYELEMLAAREGTVVVHAVRQRGSRRDELWGLDAATGARRWQYILQAQDPVGHGSSQGVWDVQLTTRGLVVLQSPPRENQLHVDTLDLKDGRIGQTSTVKLAHDDIGAVVWTDSVAYVACWGKLYAVNLVTGAADFTWP
jgi:outer membrane protein assembly factor BamB